MRGDHSLGTDEPEHLTSSQRFFVRCRRAFVRRWWLCVLPLLALSAFGVYKAATAADEFRSTGSLSVSDQSFVGQLTDVRSAAFSYETVAVRSARQFNSLMGTDEFPNTIATNAGLAAQLESGELTLLNIRSSVYATSIGDDLIQVVAVSNDPVRAQALSASAIKSYRDWILQYEVSGSDAAEKFFDQQLAENQAAIDTATNALNDYLESHPAPAKSTNSERDIAEQLEITRLSDQVSRAQSRYDSVIDNRDQSKLATLQSDADIEQRFQVVDAPIVPITADAPVKKKLTTTVLYGTMGLLLTVVLVALLALLDRTVSSEDDLEWLDIPLLGIVPHDRRVRIKNANPSVTVPSVAAGEPMREAG